MMKRRWWTWLLVLLTPGLVQAEEVAEREIPKPLHLYLLIGQSNMAGRGLLEEAHHDFPERVFLFNRQDEFEPATHPLNQHSSIGKALKMQKMNLGYSFAQRMCEARPQASIGLIVNARGGTGIQHWLRGTHYYQEAVRRARLAARHGQLRGILWHQGEHNSGSPEGYDEKLAQLTRDLRADLGDKELPFVAGQVVDRPETRAINERIANFPRLVSHAGYVPSDGLTMMDRWHFDTPSLLKLGRGYAAEMLRIESTRAGQAGSGKPEVKTLGEP